MYPHNILVVSASIGSGHTQAAVAAREKLLHRLPNAHITVVDFLEGSHWLELIKETYLKMLDVFSPAYDFLYQLSQHSFSGSKAKNLTALIMKKRMLDLMRLYRPAAVVFTHPFPCCAAAYLRRSQQISAPLYAIITDFTAHRLWVHKELDLYFAPNDDAATALNHMGICQERIFTTGIPFLAKFNHVSLEQLRPSAAYVLIMGGGLGLGAVEKTIADLATAKFPYRIKVVVGNNHTLQQRLLTFQKHFPYGLEVMGYTDRIPELMANASALITKAGALTCSEALSMRLPLLLVDPLPGHEAANADYLIRQGAAVRVNNDSRLADTVVRLLTDAEQLQSLRLKADGLARPHAATDIADIIYNHLSNAGVFKMHAG